MSLSVEGQQCPVCHAYLFDEDDVVFCPVCGLAHHRDCYKHIGHCAMEDKHGTDEQYSRTEKEEVRESETATDEEEQIEENDLVTTCRHCGEQIPADSVFCPACRAPQHDSIRSHGMEGEIPLDATVDGIKVEEIAHFTMLNPVRYVKKFIELNKQNQNSWNWAAFLLPVPWAFFRKQFKLGTLLGLLQVAASLLFFPLSEALTPYVTDDKTPIARQYVAIIMENWDKIGWLPLVLAIASALLSIGVSLFLGIKGDYLYREHVFEQVLEIRKVPEEERALAFRKKGGINAFYFLLAYYATDLLPVLILSILMTIL